jgi:hypothetical protein
MTEFFKSKIGVGTFPVHVSANESIFKHVDTKFARTYVNSAAKEHVYWKFDNKTITLIDDIASVSGFPSVCNQYFVAIYESKSETFKPPSNAVIYNLDGSIHKVLKITELLAPTVLKRIEMNGDANPPLEAAKYEGGLFFNGFDWYRDQNNNYINRIAITYDLDWIEYRVLNVTTGRLGPLMGQSRL